MSQQPCRIAFCGAGHFAAWHHLPALEQRADRFQVTGFFDVNSENARQLARGHYTVYPDYDALLADDAVDFVLIITRPHSGHFALAERALQAGKHVLLEKPMTTTSRECDALIALAREMGRILTVHQNRRLDLDFLAVQDIIASGKIGAPRFIENRTVMSAYQGGDIIDFGIHLIDQSLQLNSSPLCEVFAWLANPPGAPDNGGHVDATFRFEQPPIVRMAMLPHPQQYLLNGTPAVPRFTVIGETGAFVQRFIEDPRDIMNATQNFENARPEYAVPAYLEVQRKGFYDYLYESWAGGAPLFVRPEEARNAIRAVELIVESARTNRTIAATGMLNTTEVSR
jgi:scyllo-inositol 2-dehydrogenase (NADP+)